MVEKIKKQVETIKQAIDVVNEPQHKAFLKGELLGLEIALGTIEKEKANENKKV